MRVLRVLFLVWLLAGVSHGAKLQDSGGSSNDAFGFSVSISGNLVLAGVPDKDWGSSTDRGVGFLFRGVDDFGPTASQNAALTGSDGAAGDRAGWSVSISGTLAVVGAPYKDVGSNVDQGRVWLFRNLDTASGNTTQVATLLPTDAGPDDAFGWAVAVSGNNAVVSAPWDDVGSNMNQGSAYLFRNLASASGNHAQSAKLLPSDGQAWDQFGSAVAVAGNLALVGSNNKNVVFNPAQGVVYLYRNLATASGNVTEHARLIASDGGVIDRLGTSVAVSGTTGLAGAPLADIGSASDAGAAYVFRNLNSASGVTTEHAKLVAFDAAAGDEFGTSVAIDGGLGLVGAPKADIGSNDDQGAVYLFPGLNSASGTVNASVKIYLTNGAANDRFGRAVALDAGRFVVGAPGAAGASSSSGAAWTGTARTFHQANLGNDATSTNGLSFVSRLNWIIGISTSNNTVVLSTGDSGNVTASGMGVYVGQNSGANTNRLRLSANSTLVANFVNVGAAGNSNNELEVNGVLTLTGGNVTVAAGSIVSGSGVIAGGNLVAAGSVRPGGSLGTLTVSGGDVIWNGTSSAWVFELGSPAPDLAGAAAGNSTQDKIVITGGGLLKGTGSSFVFDFAGTGAHGWYQLATWTSSTTFASSDFSYTNLAPGNTAVFHIDNSTSALYVQVIPEPAPSLLLILAAAYLWLKSGRKRSRSFLVTASPIN